MVDPGESFFACLLLVPKYAFSHGSETRKFFINNVSAVQVYRSDLVLLLM